MFLIIVTLWKLGHVSFKTGWGGIFDGKQWLGV
jgi:hypothetical protein